MVKVLQFLSGRLGEIEEGIVTGVTNVGIFVQLRKYLIDGLIRFSDLADDWWELDPRGGCVYGQRSGRSIKIGDQLRVQIAAVDVAMRDLDLALPEGELEEGGQAGPPRAGKKRARERQAEPRGRGARRSAASAGRPSAHLRSSSRSGRPTSGRGRRRR
jgi:ribonuclease R